MPMRSACHGFGRSVRNARRCSFGGFFEPFEREAMSGWGVCRKQLQAQAQSRGKFGPGFFIEARGAALCIALLAFASRFQRIKKLCAQRIVGCGKFHNPRFLNVTIANFAETAEKFAAGFAESTPGGMRIDFLKDACERTATAERDAQIVDGFVFGRGQNALAFAEHTLHPIQESFGLGGACWKGDYRSHANDLDDAAPKPAGGSPEKRRARKGRPAAGRCPPGKAELWKTQWKRGGIYPSFLVTADSKGL